MLTILLVSLFKLLNQFTIYFNHHISLISKNFSDPQRKCQKVLKCIIFTYGVVYFVFYSFFSRTAFNTIALERKVRKTYIANIIHPQ